MSREDTQKQLEEEFSVSWDYMEQFFASFPKRENWADLDAMVSFIAELRRRGYDRQLRAGQSLWTFILSCSRKHGLRDEQARLEIGWDQVGGMVVRYYELPDINVEFEHERIEITPEMEDLLKRLLTHPID